MNYINTDNIEIIISVLKKEVTNYIKANKDTRVINIDNIIKSTIKKSYPYYHFLTGKSGNYNIDPTIPTWIMSPIESVLNSHHKLENKAISLSLVYENDPLLGIVFIPSTDELYYAELGKGAFLNGNKIHVSNDNSINVSKKIYNSYPTSSAAIHICNIAAGKTNIYLRNSIRPWDYAAAKRILEEAGGKITTLKNDNITYYRKSDILATNGCIHDTIINLITN